jgi:hypothetical protein
MRRSIKLAVVLAALAAAGGGAAHVADGSRAERPAERKADVGRAPTPDERRRLEDAHDGIRDNLFPRKQSATMKPASLEPPDDFDPAVKDVLGDSGDIAGLVDDVLADLPEQPAPSVGGVTPGDIAGGGGTDEILGFINGGNNKISGIANDVLAGKDLTPEQREICDFLIRKGPSIDAWSDITAVNRQIDVDLANAHLRELYPHGFRDSLGNFWKPNHQTGRWTKVTEHPTGGSPVYRTPAPGVVPDGAVLDRPRSSPGPSSGEIANQLPKPSLLDGPKFQLFD